MRKYSKISNKETEELFKEFCEAISVLKSSEEIMNFITDLLTKQEIIALAKRIRIAKLLIEGKDYREIEGLSKTSHGTIAKISQWLSEKGDGFRVITERTKKKKPKPETSFGMAMGDWRKFRKRYPLFFWPQLLIEDIIKTMDKKQKKRVCQLIEKLDHKSETYKQINRLI